MEIEKDKKEKTSKKNKKKEIEKPAEQIVFGAYKQRGETETLFDSYKTILTLMFPTCRTGT